MIVKYNGKNVLSIPSNGTPIVLKPGVNAKVDSEAWEAAVKNNAVIQAKIDESQIVLVPSKIETTKGEEKKKAEAEVQKEIEDGAAKSLAEFNSKESVKIVQETFDVAVLEEWEIEEGRIAVVKAIKKQLKEIEAQGE